MRRRYVVLANPGSIRRQFYQRELTEFWARRGLRPEVTLIPWRRVIPRDGNLDALGGLDEPALVRMESPGRDFEVTKLLLEAGQRAAPEQPQTAWGSLACERGKLIRPGLQYQGFKRVLTGLAASFAARPHLVPLADPRAIARMFDKNACSAQFESSGIPCPPRTKPPASLDQLFAESKRRGFTRAYVKLAMGASASGIALVRFDRHNPSAITTVLRRGGDFYNTRRLQRIDGAELREVLSFIVAQGACVQKAISMARIDGQNFDVRVVVIHGRPAFTIFRLSSGPFTNLHLGGRRGNWEACRRRIPPRAWLDGLDHCVEAASQFNCAAVGVDLLFERGYASHYILEVNAFGDFFPRWTNRSGQTVHAFEIETTARRYGYLAD